MSALVILAIAWWLFVISGLATMLGFDILNYVFPAVPAIGWGKAFLVNVAAFLILGGRSK